MFSQENDFYVCLLSSNSMNYYPENTLSSFTNHLSSPLNLEGVWKVGITEIAFNSYYKFNGPMSFERKKRSPDAMKIQTNVSASDRKPHNNNNNNSTFMFMPQSSPGPANVNVVIGKKQSSPNETSSFTPVLYIPQALSQLPDPVPKTIQPIKSFDIPPPIFEEPKELGFNKINRDNESYNVSPYLNYMHVYTDFIKPRFIGDIKSRYLKIIPKLDADASVFKFDHIEYCSLEKSYIENLTILILNNFGEKIDFMNSMNPTYVMLHFKKTV